MANYFSLYGFLRSLWLDGTVLKKRNSELEEGTVTAKCQGWLRSQSRRCCRPQLRTISRPGPRWEHTLGWPAYTSPPRGWHPTNTGPSREPHTCRYLGRGSLWTAPDARGRPGGCGPCAARPGRWPPPGSAPAAARRKHQRGLGTQAALAAAWEASGYGTQEARKAAEATEPRSGKKAEGQRGSWRGEEAVSAPLRGVGDSMQMRRARGRVGSAPEAPPLCK